MTKAELVTEVAKATGLNKKASGAAVGAVFEAIENSLAKEKYSLSASEPSKSGKGCPGRTKSSGSQESH